MPTRRRPSPAYHWTDEKMIAFMEALAATASVTAAAAKVGMSRQSAYRLRARLDPERAALWDGVAVLARRLRTARR
ncbi:hypothetical protein [Novosphingobium sp. JCM 18896]|uniref:hypothetical protein n=1 Tax=Novosphingobium sp. JCM 18896 TaxID=2989731 RepID=UPI00222209F1|nr:hypothetical protein [Novosphingobium sp. JCM 18896]MCW1431862.1 hypothetical protein [Novosphingobium sp. JCM 18896]